jgi:CRISPR/Cas system-associated exonuclease Cas4 (RecB family)
MHGTGTEKLIKLSIMPEIIQPQPPHIQSTSFSRLSVFEECPKRAKLQFIDRIPDPRPRTAADRGTAIHQLAEDYGRGLIADLPKELSKFSDEFSQIRRLFEKDKALMEDEWGYDQEWKPTEWNGAWLRMKLDALVWLSDEEVVVIDFKTGRKFGNEIKHGDQCLNYAAATAARYPEVQLIHTELWYLDQNELSYSKHPRHKALAALARYDKRHKAVTNATNFPATPNAHACKWCPYKPSGTGHCAEGVDL